MILYLQSTHACSRNAHTTHTYTCTQVRACVHVHTLHARRWLLRGKDDPLMIPFQAEASQCAIQKGLANVAAALEGAMAAAPGQENFHAAINGAVEALAVAVEVSRA